MSHGPACVSLVLVFMGMIGNSSDNKKDGDDDDHDIIDLLLSSVHSKSSWTHGGLFAGCRWCASGRAGGQSVGQRFRLLPPQQWSLHRLPFPPNCPASTWDQRVPPHLHQTVVDPSLKFWNQKGAATAHPSALDRRSTWTKLHELDYYRLFYTPILQN